MSDCDIISYLLFNVSACMSTDKLPHMMGWETNRPRTPALGIKGIKGRTREGAREKAHERRNETLHTRPVTMVPLTTPMSPPRASSSEASPPAEASSPPLPLPHGRASSVTLNMVVIRSSPHQYPLTRCSPPSPTVSVYSALTAHTARYPPPVTV